jgi:hypothetical protein
MSSSKALLPPDPDQREAFDTLLQMARRRTGRVPPELLAGHVVAIYREADWPVKRAATEALLRRFDFARLWKVRGRTLRDIVNQVLREGLSRFPTPRRPVMIMLFSGLPRRRRSRSTRKASS